MKGITWKVTYIPYGSISKGLSYLTDKIHYSEIRLSCIFILVSGLSGFLLCTSFYKRRENILASNLNIFTPKSPAGDMLQVYYPSCLEDEQDVSKHSALLVCQDPLST